MKNHIPKMQITCTQELLDYYNLSMTGEQKKLFRELIRKTMNRLSRMSAEELKAELEK